jgi:hypothetical protein
MQRKRYRNVLLASVLTLAFSGIAQALPVWTVDTIKGSIMKDGEVFRVKGGSWFGLEGRHEAPDDKDNPSGAPMELYIGNVFWNASSRTYESDAKEFKQIGLNCVRMPVVPQTFNDADSQGIGKVLKNTESVRIQGSYTALKKTLKALDDAGLYVLLDLHSCSNYVGWRKGRLDARPPWADANRTPYDYKREDCSCSSTGNPTTVKRVQAYDKTKWLANLKQLAGLDKELGLKNGTIGIDIYNEPWDYSWEEWTTLIDEAYQAISSVNPNILIFAQGVGATNGNQDGSPETVNKTPHGDWNANWGENCFEADIKPPKMPKTKLVFSPHAYGPSVCTQPQFADTVAQPQCAGLVEDAFGDAKCQIVINPELLAKGWNEHFGKLRAKGFAICVGEFGGNMDWPAKSDQRHVTRYSYLTNKTSDKQWQEAFVNYLVKMGLTNTFYWSINPESADTYGLFKSSYDPQSNKSGWGSWTGVDDVKLTMLKKLWDAPEIPPVPVEETAVVPFRSVSKKSTTFNCRATNAGFVSYTLPEAGNVTASLYNVDGRLHGEVMNQNQSAGSHSFNFTAPSGSYILVLKAGEHSSKQMVTIAK